MQTTARERAMMASVRISLDRSLALWGFLLGPALLLSSAAPAQDGAFRPRAFRRNAFPVMTLRYMLTHLP